MKTLNQKTVESWRTNTFRLSRNAKLRTPADAVRYVEERGFVYFWPIKNVIFPSLWTAVAGDRPVASAHDDPGHITWGWKDQMLPQRKWYYGKILRGKATMISLQTAPYFYALTNNYGDPEAEYKDQYADGLMSQSAKNIYEALLENGPIDTVNLRRKIHMTGKASNSPFERALVELQRDFKILPVGVARTGGWRYSFQYDLVHRYYPDIPEQAQAIPDSVAYQHLAGLYFAAVGAATARDVQRLFQWPPRNVQICLQNLVARGKIKPGIKISGREGEQFMWHELGR